MKAEIKPKKSRNIMEDLRTLLLLFWPAETLFNAVSTRICSHLLRNESEPLVNFVCCRDNGYLN